jgi:phage antirepressor YoqD-like protein
MDKYTHTDSQGMLFRFEGTRPISKIADEIMQSIKEDSNKKKMECLKVFNYNGTSIQFDVDKSTLINVTDFAKAFPDKNLSQIVNSQEITDYINTLAEIQNISSADLLIVRKGGNDRLNQGTWANSKVALRIAQKLSVNFAIWVDMKLEELLTKGTVSLNNLPDFTNPVIAARAWADEVEKKQLAESKVKELAPKAEVYDKISDATNLKTISEVAKVLGTGQKRLFEYLRANNILMKSNLPYQTYIEQGLFEVKTKPISHIDKDYSQTYVTAKGELWLAKRLNDE